MRTCAQASSIRAMPENEIPPAMRVDIYSRRLFKIFMPFVLPEIPFDAEILNPRTEGDKMYLWEGKHGRCNHIFFADTAVDFFDLFSASCLCGADGQGAVVFFVLFGGGFRVRRNLFFFKRSGISGNLYFCASLFFDDGFRSSIIRR